MILSKSVSVHFLLQGSVSVEPIIWKTVLEKLKHGGRTHDSSDTIAACSWWEVIVNSQSDTDNLSAEPFPSRQVGVVNRKLKGNHIQNLNALPSVNVSHNKGYVWWLHDEAKFLTWA